jgi:hypothetical protein
MENDTTRPAPDGATLTLPDARYLVRTGHRAWRVTDSGAHEGWATTREFDNATRYTLGDAQAIVSRHSSNPFALWRWSIEEILSPHAFEAALS